MSVQILVDSACDLGLEEAKQKGLRLLPLRICFGETEYLDGVDLDHEGFFHKLIETDVLPTTSQISPYEYGQYFKDVVKNGDTAVCITLSSKLSGCYQSACIAARDYEGQIFIVDSENACIGQRILAEYAARLVSEGMSAKEIADELDKSKKNIRLIALLDTLEYLKKGGRISAATAMAGSLLSIKPVIAIMHGEVAVLGKARGSKAGNNKLTELIEQENVDLNKPYILAYSGLSDMLLRKYMEDYSGSYKDKVHDVPIGSIGCAIGTHAGPGAIGVAFFVEQNSITNSRK